MTIFSPKKPQLLQAIKTGIQTSWMISCKYTYIPVSSSFFPPEFPLLWQVAVGIDFSRSMMSTAIFGGFEWVLRGRLMEYILWNGDNQAPCLYDRASNWQASPHALVQHSHGVIVDIICRSSNMDLICFAVVKSVSSYTLLSTDLLYIFGLVGFSPAWWNQTKIMFFIILCSKPVSRVAPRRNSIVLSILR